MTRCWSEIFSCPVNISSLQVSSPKLNLQAPQCFLEGGAHQLNMREFGSLKRRAANNNCRPCCVSNTSSSYRSALNIYKMKRKSFFFLPAVLVQKSFKKANIFGETFISCMRNRSFPLTLLCFLFAQINESDVHEQILCSLFHESRPVSLCQQEIGLLTPCRQQNSGSHSNTSVSSLHHESYSHFSLWACCFIHVWRHFQIILCAYFIFYESNTTKNF